MYLCRFVLNFAENISWFAGPLCYRNPVLEWPRDIGMNEQMEFPWNKAPVEDGAHKTVASPRPAPKTAQAPVNGGHDSRREMLHQAQALRDELAQRSGLHVSLRITNNSSTMMSVRYGENGTAARLSLHHMFLTAPPKVRTALVRWLKNPKAKRSGEKLNAFIRERNHQVVPRAPRRITLYTQGRHHDLARYFREVNAGHFDNTITAAITWGRMPRLTRRRSIRFGSYMPSDRIIRIHPLLDQDFVPDFFVRYVVYHEMLHAHLGIGELPSGRRSIHGKTFRDQEKNYPDFQRATEWGADAKNLKRLLQRYKKGR